jgi:hypothetical protein
MAMQNQPSAWMKSCENRMFSGSALSFLRGHCTKSGHTLVERLQFIDL